MRAAVARADETLHAAPEFEQDLRQLRGLARTGFAADDDHLMLGHGSRDVGAPGADRQLFRVLRFGAGGAALFQLGGGVTVLLRMHAPAVGLLGLHPAHSTGSGNAARAWCLNTLPATA
jgi:hypothetical protein